jgi:hypothetical protein
MRQGLQREVARLGGDPASPVWQWLIMMGPHGSSFSWGQRRDQPAGYVGLEHLQRVVHELAEQDPSFPQQALAAARLAIQSSDRELLRRGIQVTVALGATAELASIQRLVSHADPVVAADAKAGLFALRHLSNRLKGDDR